MTRWLLFSLLHQPRWPHTAPTSHNDSLVLFPTSPLTTPVTTSTSESLRLAGAFSHFSLDHAGHNKHQQVLRTCWRLLPQQRQPQWAPTSHNDSLVPFFSSPSTTPATHCTNESLRLVGASFLDHARYTPPQQVIMTRWCFFP